MPHGSGGGGHSGGGGGFGHSGGGGGGGGFGHSGGGFGHSGGGAGHGGVVIPGRGQGGARPWPGHGGSSSWHYPSGQHYVPGRHHGIHYNNFYGRGYGYVYGVDGVYPIAVLDTDYLNLRPCAASGVACYSDEDCVVFEDGSSKCVQHNKYRYAP